MIDCYVKYCKTLFERYGKRCKYWLTFNEINAVRGFGPCGTRESDGKVRYQADHHMFVASAKAVILGHQMMPGSIFGTMYAMSELYPATCKPEDMFKRLQARRENWYFIDTMARGYYHPYAKSVWKHHDFDSLEITEEDKEILKGLNLKINKGEVHVIMGPNGAGKSTTMKIIMSLVKETQGQLELFESTDNQVNRGRIGAIIEQPAFYPYMTAYENLQYYIKFKGIVEANSIENVLKMVGLENAATKKYKNYSLGMKQRLGLALALINNPDLLILDEPLNGLDPQGIAELRETLRHLNKKYGITMVISSHILDELEMIATRYGFIHKGHMIEEITVDELHEKLKKYISLDVENISLATITIEQKLNTVNYKVVNDHTIYLYDYVNDGAKVASTLIKEGVMIEKMNVSNMSLENYYFSLIKGVENNV